MSDITAVIDVDITAVSAESFYAITDTPGLEQITETDNFKVVDVASLKPFKGAMRYDYGSFKEFMEFCDSIKEVGLLQPIVVRPIPNDSVSEGIGDQKYEVVAGVRRLFALRHLGVKTTPVIIRDLNDVTNIHFQPLEELEIIEAKKHMAIPESQTKK